VHVETASTNEESGEVHDVLAPARPSQQGRSGRTTPARPTSSSTRHRTPSCHRYGSPL